MIRKQSKSLWQNIYQNLQQYFIFPCGTIRLKLDQMHRKYICRLHVGHKYNLELNQVCMFKLKPNFYHFKYL